MAPVTGTPVSSAHPCPAGIPQVGTAHTPMTSSMFVDSHTPILLQTARATVCDATQQCDAPTLDVRAILDTGSQGSYVTARVREALGARTIHSETMIIKTVVCQRFQGRPYASPPVPPLPSFRVNEARPFSYTGVHFAGPLYVRDSVSSTARKVWLCLYTCCVTRAVHLDIVPDMTAEAFIQCFRRFTARRGFPTRMISDNAKTSRLPRELWPVLWSQLSACFSVILPSSGRLMWRELRGGEGSLKE